MRVSWLCGAALAVALGVGGCSSMMMSSEPVAASPEVIAAAVADPTRPDKDRAQDASRHPEALVAFSGLKPGDTVIDIWTGGGYWSRIFGKVVGPTGHVYAYVPAEIAGFKSKPVDVAKAMAAEPGRGNVEEISDHVADQPPPQFQGMVDVAFIFENYHDLHDSFMKQPDGKLADVDAYNRAIFKLLKPGGRYIIVDHTAPAGSGLKNTEDLHRIDPAAVRAEVEKAGFRFDGQSNVLANPADPKDKIVFDPSIRGKTDRFAYRFVKPRT